MKNLFNKKSQSAFEFIMVLSFMLFFFILFYTAIQDNLADKIKERNSMVLKSFALGIKNEIDLAYSATNGYSREFTIPENLGGVIFNVTIISGIIYLKTDVSSLGIPAAPVDGNLLLGKNIIRKENNTIYLNK
jgi:hypothetical protein